MNKLSAELIEHIASYLDAGTVLALSTVCRATRQPCLSRLSPERYLQRTFRHAASLLAAMTDHGCVISGSRALEYFVPGSIADETEEDENGDVKDPSDWDFLVPCVESSVLGMMDALSACGVDWGDHNLSELLALPEKPVGSTATVTAMTAKRLLNTRIGLGMRPLEEITEWLQVCGALDRKEAKDARTKTKAKAKATTLRAMQNAKMNEVGEAESTGTPPRAVLSADVVSMLQELYIYVKNLEMAEFCVVVVQLLLPEAPGWPPKFRFSKLQSDGDDQAEGYRGYGGGDYNAFSYAGPAGKQKVNAVFLINGNISVPFGKSSAANKSSSTGGGGSSRGQRRRRVKVQLFQCHRGGVAHSGRSRSGDGSLMPGSFWASTPLEYIVDTFYATHVQCFISGFCAGHFFHTLARERHAIVWPSNYGKSHALAKCVSKYRRRGFHFRYSQQLDDEIIDHLVTVPADEKVGGVAILPLIAKSVGASRLGESGTLLVRFVSLENKLGSHHGSHHGNRRRTDQLYYHLFDSVHRLRIDHVCYRPVAIEPNLHYRFIDNDPNNRPRFLFRNMPPYPEGKSFVSPHSISANLAPLSDDAAAGPQAILPVGVLTPGDANWKRWERLLALAPFSCGMGICDNFFKHEPPQI